MLETINKGLNEIYYSNHELVFIIIIIINMYYYGGTLALSQNMLQDHLTVSSLTITN